MTTPSEESSFDPRTLDQSDPRIQQALWSVFRAKQCNNILKIEITEHAYIVTWDYPGCPPDKPVLTDYLYSINAQLTREVEAAVIKYLNNK